MQRDQSIEVTDEGCVSAESKAGLEKFLLGKDAKFVETHRLELCPVMLGELRKRRPPPTRESAF
jgi:hypothetical protein